VLGRTAFRPAFVTVAVVAVVASFGAGALAATTRGGMHKAGPSEALAYAMVRPDGTIDPAFTSSNISNANIQHPSAGLYCFVGMPFPPNSAVVSGENSFNQNDTLASVTIDNVLGDEPPGTDIGGGCTKPTAYARVRTIDNDGTDGAPTATYNPKLMDRQFIVWFRGTK
jgi:hypothetical protein